MVIFVVAIMAWAGTDFVFVFMVGEALSRNWPVAWGLLFALIACVSVSIWLSEDLLLRLSRLPPFQTE